MFSERAIARFWSRVEAARHDDCWLWTGNHDRKGYGKIIMNGRHMRAHRVSLMIKLGEQLPPGLVVLHACDNPPCVNPSHLSLGTHQENMDDMTRKGRRRMCVVGTQSTQAKLTEQIVIQLLWDRVGGMTFSEISSRYGINIKTAAQICRGTGWPHVPGMPGAPTLGDLLAVPVNSRSNAKITEEQAIEIMRRLAKGEPGKQIAREMGIHFASVSDIKQGNTWRHLQGVNGLPTLEQMLYAKPKSKFTAKLTEPVATEIKQLLKQGLTSKLIAVRFGISRAAVDHIRQGRTWGSIS